MKAALPRNLKGAKEVLEFMMRAVEKAGYRPGVDIVFALDAGGLRAF